jgi:hypothetical protein
MGAVEARNADFFLSEQYHEMSLVNVKVERPRCKDLKGDYL